MVINKPTDVLHIVNERSEELANLGCVDPDGLAKVIMTLVELRGYLQEAEDDRRVAKFMKERNMPYKFLIELFEYDLRQARFCAERFDEIMNWNKES